MSLNWNCKAMIERGINIWCERDDGEYLNPVTESLIWATMIVGCDGSNIDRFITRVRECEIANGAIFRPWPTENRDKDISRNVIRPDTFTKDGYISAAEVRRHEGMSTNASAITDAQWLKKLSRLVVERAARSMRCEGN
jgi:hypothetical protein